MVGVGKEEVIDMEEGVVSLIRIRGRELEGNPLYNNLGDLIFKGPIGEVILTHRGNSILRIDTGSFRHAISRSMIEMGDMGLRKGDTICILRLSKAPEAPVAVAYAAASTMGVRTLLPMTVELASLDNWLDITGTKALFWSRAEVEMHERTEKGSETIQAVASMLDEKSIPSRDLEADLSMWDLLTRGGEDRYREEIKLLRPQTVSRNDVNVIISTSGTTGESKLVELDHGQFIDSCQAWESAGFFKDEALKGPGYTPLLSHTMGVRYFWNSIWTGTPTCLLTPEWFVDKPEKAASILSSFSPTHITAGPAMFGMLLELAGYFPEIMKPLLTELRCCVSSGVPYDEEIASLFKKQTGIRLQNAFGTTETLQITNTLLREKNKSNISLGAPLPGVEIGLKYKGKGLYRILVKSPFGSRGYLHDPQGPSAGGFVTIGNEAWFDSGDLVEYIEGEMFYAGRDARDFIKDGFGVKIPLMAIDQMFGDLHPGIGHIEAFPCLEGPGLGMLLFIKEEYTGSKNLKGSIKEKILVRNGFLDKMLEEFESRHLTCRRFHLVFIEPPRTRKGEVDRKMIEIKMAKVVNGLKDRSLAMGDEMVEFD